MENGKECRSKKPLMVKIIEILIISTLGLISFYFGATKNDREMEQLKVQHQAELVQLKQNQVEEMQLAILSQKQKLYDEIDDATINILKYKELEFKKTSNKGDDALVKLKGTIGKARIRVDESLHSLLTNEFGQVIQNMTDLAFQKGYLAGITFMHDEVVDKKFEVVYTNR